MNERELWEAAWWSAVAEPGDPCARVVRRIFGDRGAREWLQSRWTGVPEQLAVHQRIDWRSGTGGASVRCWSISMLTWTALHAAEEDSWFRAIRVGPYNSLAWEKTNRWVYGSEVLFLRLREQGSISLLSALEPPREQEIDVPETWRHSSPLLE